MNNTSGGKNRGRVDAAKIAALRSYFKTRLDHTIQHTQQITRLIYFVSGAVIAAFYFVSQHANASAKCYLELSLLFLLGVVNFIHAKLTRRQGKWYRYIDDEFARAVWRPEEGRIHLEGISSAAWYAYVHWAIVAFCICAIVVIALTGPV